MSFTNARRRQISQAQLARFEEAIADAERDPGEPRSAEEAMVRAALLDQARQQADDLRSQIAALEA